LLASEMWTASGAVKGALPPAIGVNAFFAIISLSMSFYTFCYARISSLHKKSPWKNPLGLYAGIFGMCLTLFFLVILIMEDTLFYLICIGVFLSYALFAHYFSTKHQLKELKITLSPEGVFWVYVSSIAFCVFKLLHVIILSQLMLHS
jgi:hypothetical protein